MCVSHINCEKTCGKSRTDFYYNIILIPLYCMCNGRETPVGEQQVKYKVRVFLLTILCVPLRDVRHQLCVLDSCFFRLSSCSKNSRLPSRARYLTPWVIEEGHLNSPLLTSVQPRFQVCVSRDATVNLSCYFCWVRIVIGGYITWRMCSLGILQHTRKMCGSWHEYSVIR